jgi:hypothetical protein
LGLLVTGGLFCGERPFLRLRRREREEMFDKGTWNFVFLLDGAARAK